MSEFTAHDCFAVRDLKAMLALSDARKRENAESRLHCKQNASLVAHLTAEAVRRGVPLDWDDYFRQIGV
jgi:hypothetical protein